MRKVMFFMLTSVNGYYERGEWALDWHNVDAEFNAFAIAQLDASDLIVFGRTTFEGMASYWPTDAALRDDADVARRMNAMAKIVFSSSLTEAAWQNTRLVQGDAAEELTRLKAAPGRDIIVMGSGRLAASLAERGIIDEFRILVNPIALPHGTPLFTGLTTDLRLELLSARAFRSGNVLLTYGPGDRAR